MVTLLALIAGSATPSLVEALNPVDPINQLDISQLDIDPVQPNLAIYPIRTPTVLYLSELARTNSSNPVDSKELDEYQIGQIDENVIASGISSYQIDTAEDSDSIAISTTDEMVIQGSPGTCSDIEPASAFHHPQSQPQINPNPDYWPEGLLNRDNSMTYGDLRDWLNDLNSIYDEEPLFRSILKLPVPSGQSQLFPDHISSHPTYQWVLDNCLTDWINNRVMGAISPDPDDPIDVSRVSDSNESAPHNETPKTFDQIYIPFIEKFEFQDDALTGEFFHKIYELLAPLRGLLVIAIAGIDRRPRNTITKGRCTKGQCTKGQWLSSLLNQSGIPASSIGVISSHNQSFLLVKRNQAQELRLQVNHRLQPPTINLATLNQDDLDSSPKF